MVALFLLLSLLKRFILGAALQLLEFRCALCLCRQFVRCVRCIKILSPSEVQKMSEEGMKLLNSAAMQG
jgi:hypothetical protein